MKFNEFNYERPDLEALKKEILDHVDALKQAESPEDALAAVHEIQAIQNRIQTLSVLVYIRHSIDTRDTFYEEEQAFWDENGPLISEWVNAYYRAVLESPHLEDLKKELPATFFQLIELDLKIFSPEIISLMQKENKLGTEYGKLIASAEIEYKGEVYNLPGLAKFAQSTDRAERKEVSLLSSTFFADNCEEIDRIYDEMVKVRTEMAHQLGFDNFIEMGYARMKRLDYTREDVEVYRKEVLKEIVPLVQDIYQRQADRLGLDSLKSYDLPLSFPSGNAKPEGSLDELVAKARQMYEERSSETHEFFEFMLDHDLMDLETKKGKQGGAYCDYIPDYDAPFIFSNANGTAHDVETLTHEAGHAFQVYESRWVDTPECVWPTHESCEIHSMSMEFLTWPWMDLFFQDATEKFKYDHLSGTAIFLPYGVLVDHFQHEVYEHPEMTPQERRAKWRELEQQYNPWKDYSEDPFLAAGGYWFRQGHIFNAPFYYIDYTLAQVCALQFWVRSHVEQDATHWQDYLAICKVGGTQSFTQIVETANLKSPFEEGSLTQVASAIREYLDQVPESALE